MKYEKVEEHDKTEEEIFFHQNVQTFLLHCMYVTLKQGGEKYFYLCNLNKKEPLKSKDCPVNGADDCCSLDIPRKYKLSYFSL